MEKFESISLFLGVLGILFALLVLFKKTSQKRTKIIFSTIIFILSLRLIDFFQLSSLKSISFFVGYSKLFFPAIGFLYFIMIKKLFKIKVNIKWIVPLFFLLFLQNLYLTINLIILNFQEIDLIEYVDLINNKFNFKFSFITEITLNLFFLIISLYYLIKEPINKKIKWYKYINILLLINCSAPIFVLFIDFRWFDYNILIILISIVSSSVIFYSAISSIDIKILLPENIKEENSTKLKYARSSLNKDKSEIIYAKLIKLFEEKELFKQQNLKISEVSKILDISINHLSQTINQISGKSFNELVNEYRIISAQKYLVDPKYSHYTILAIAYEVGFNSKATFYYVFKKVLKKTPSEFIKENNKMKAEI